MVSYTYSKAIDIGSSGWYGVEGHSVQDPYNFNNDRSSAGFDLTQVLTVSGLYALPIGKGKALQTGSKFADYILGNWQINGIAQKIKFKGLKAKALECMEGIAKERGFTRAEPRR